LGPVVAGSDLPGEVHHRVDVGQSFGERMQAGRVAQVGGVPLHPVVRWPGVRSRAAPGDADHLDVRLGGQPAQQRGADVAGGPGDRDPHVRRSTPPDPGHADNRF
jgi:hypothetical protein